MSLTKTCLVFHWLAQRTWELCRRNRYYPITLREDAITALNLQELYSNKISSLLIFDFTPYQEAFNTGADWEWWFLQKGYYIGAAVQAKLLGRDLCYNIDYVSRSTGQSQIQKLLDYCVTNGLTPQYCFYNYWEMTDNVINHWPCLCINQNLMLWGCALAHGVVIWKLHNYRKYHINDILPVCIPWHCIVCCNHYFYDDSLPVGPGNRASGLMERLRRFNKIVIEKYGDENSYDKLNEITIHKEMPVRVKELIIRHRKGVPIDKEILSKYWGEIIPKKVILQGNLELY